MHETCAHAVYAVLIFHIAHEIRLFFNAVRLVICRFGSIFYVEKEPAIRQDCRSPPLSEFQNGLILNILEENHEQK